MSTKRKRILRTAGQEFLQHGFDGTSIDAIVKSVGGSKSTIYSHFKDKTVLFAEALAEAQEELDFSLPRFHQEDAAGVRESLEMIGVELLSVLYRVRALHLARVIVAESHRFPAVAERFWDEGPAVALDTIARFLSDHSNTGDLSFSDPTLAARHLFGLFLGDRYLRFLFGIQPAPAPDEIASIAREAVALFLTGEDTG